ncbi:hypothetical protein DYS74_14115 [Sinirhodobacter hankyongi]|uniref:Uncharacterized protein n=1 Tax=Paenirhodobacter hankyongi TaxID=2294033 RepID=A0A421BLN2_9RHOB|nr:hypothetical protein DYS74_14115 [Sinirhodobacter hankyongi]
MENRLTSKRGRFRGAGQLLPTRVVVSPPRFKPNSATVDFWDRWRDAEPVAGTEDAVLSWRRQSNL